MTEGCEDSCLVLVSATLLLSKDSSNTSPPSSSSPSSSSSSPSLLESSSSPWYLLPPAASLRSMEDNFFSSLEATACMSKVICWFFFNNAIVDTIISSFSTIAVCKTSLSFVMRVISFFNITIWVASFSSFLSSSSSSSMLYFETFFSNASCSNRKSLFIFSCTTMFCSRLWLCTISNALYFSMCKWISSVCKRICCANFCSFSDAIAINCFL